MKLLVAIREPHETERRAGSPASNTADRPVDASTQTFDGVLAKVSNKQEQAPTKIQSSNAASTNPQDPTQARAQAGNSKNPGPSSASSLAAPADLEADDASVDKLLKRLKSKHDDGSADAKDANSSASVVPALVVGLPAGPTTRDGHSGPKKGDGLESTKSRPAEFDGDAEPTQSDTAARADSAVVLGVSVSAYIAPIKNDETRLASPDDDTLRPALRPDGYLATLVGSDAPGSSDHDDKPQGDGKSDLGSQNKIEAPAGPASASFAPPSPVRGIATAVAELANQASSTAATPETSKAISATPARTVVLRMSPADLGLVEIRLHMSGHALDLQLTISEQRTLGLVSRERDTLAKALEDQHYDLNSLVIQGGSAVPPSGGTHVAKHEPSGGSHTERQTGDGGGSGPQTGGEGRRGQDADRSARGKQSGHRDSTHRTRLPDGGSLFI